MVEDIHTSLPSATTINNNKYFTKFGATEKSEQSPVSPYGDVKSFRKADAPSPNNIDSQVSRAFNLPLHLKMPNTRNNPEICFTEQSPNTIVNPKVASTE